MVSGPEDELDFDNDEIFYPDDEPLVQGMDCYYEDYEADRQQFIRGVIRDFNEGR